MKSSIFFRSATLFCVIITLITLFTGCGTSYKNYTSFAMGSILNAKIYADDDKSAELFEKITDRVSAADKCLSATLPDSEIYRVNRDNGGIVSPYTLTTLEHIITICNIFEGDIDITVGAVSSLWGFATDSPSLPADKDIKQALETVDLSGVLIDENNSRVILQEGQQLDLGAFGKGAALDEAYYALKTDKAPAVVDLGGSILFYGNAPKKDGWTVGITNPYGDGASPMASFNVKQNEGEAAFISTSGSYNKTVTVNEETYHHILSPKTGYPVETNIVSVTVLAPSGLTSDALSTACFIGGLNDDTLSRLKSFDAEAVFLFNDMTYYVTDGLKNNLELLNKNYTAREYEKN